MKRSIIAFSTATLIIVFTFALPAAIPEDEATETTEMEMTESEQGQLDEFIQQPEDVLEEEQEPPMEQVQEEAEENLEQTEQKEETVLSEAEIELAGKSESGLVTMDFEEADIRDVVKVIAMASGVNMVIGKDVQAKVTISLKEVPWEKALDVILRTYNFTYKKEENLIRIMTFEKVKQEERDIPLTTKIICLNFSDVSSMKTTLTKSLSERGSIEVDSRTNSMVVTDIPARVEEIEKVALALDTRTPQVMIEAMLIDVQLTEDDELGINWNIVHVDRHVPLGPDDDATSSWKTKTASDNYIEQPAGMSTITDTAIKFGWLQQIGSFRLDGLIQAWVKNNKAKILASPKVLTLDNQEATIEIVLEIPYVSDMSEQGNVSYSFKEVGTKLYVTPHITSGGFVSMNLKPEMSYQSATTGDGQPVISTRKAETNVLVQDGETIVIGGLRRLDETKTYTKVPFLGDIPLLGALFRKKDNQAIDTELLMFVTPHILIKPHLSPDEYDKFKWLERIESKKKKKEKRKQAAFLMDSEQGIPQPRSDFELEQEMTPQAITEEELKEKDLLEEDYIYSW